MKLRSNSVKKTFVGLLKEYFITGFPWRKRLGMANNRYQQGNSRINTFKDIVVILGIGGILSGADFSFIPFWVFILLAILWVIGCYTIGYADEKWGFWKEQQKHLTGEIDLIHKEMMENIKIIKELLKKNESSRIPPDNI